VGALIELVVQAVLAVSNRAFAAFFVLVCMVTIALVIALVV